MAFISEVNFKGDGGIASGEFVEIALGTGDDPADFVVSVYHHTGVLHTGAGISGGEVTLSSLTGTPDPDNAAYTIYVIPVGVKNADSDSNEGSGIALTDTSTGGGVIDFYSASNIAPITATAGAASGATSSDILDHFALVAGESYQWDIDGSFTIGPITSGDAVLCITSESQVRTRNGKACGQDLKVGDLVWTLDHGYQPIRWIGSKILTRDVLAKAPKNRPICIRRNALGTNMPARDLLVSPQHRILGRSKIAERMFGSVEVLIAATKLAELDGVEQIDSPNGVHYIHILFDHHEIIEVDGALVESLLIAEQSSSLIDDLDYVAAPRDLEKCPMVPARLLIEGKRCKSLIQRLLKNNKPIFDDYSESFDLKRAR